MKWAAREPRTMQVETVRFCGNYDQKRKSAQTARWTGVWLDGSAFPLFPLKWGKMASWARVGPPPVFSADPSLV